MRITNTDYSIGSTEYLKLLAENDGHLVLERGFPRGKLKRDFISLRHRDGRAVSLRTPSGFAASPIELHPVILEDFLRARLVEQDGPEDAEGRVTYRMTAEGLRRGLS